MRPWDVLAMVTLIWDKVETPMLVLQHLIQTASVFSRAWLRLPALPSSSVYVLSVTSGNQAISNCASDQNSQSISIPHGQWRRCRAAQQTEVEAHSAWVWGGQRQTKTLYLLIFFWLLYCGSETCKHLSHGPLTDNHPGKSLMLQFNPGLRSEATREQRKVTNRFVVTFFMQCLLFPATSHTMMIPQSWYQQVFNYSACPYTTLHYYNWPGFSQHSSWNDAIKYLTEGGVVGSKVESETSFTAYNQI